MKDTMRNLRRTGNSKAIESLEKKNYGPVPPDETVVRPQGWHFHKRLLTFGGEPPHDESWARFRQRWLDDEVKPTFSRRLTRQEKLEQLKNIGIIIDC